MNLPVHNSHSTPYILAIALFRIGTNYLVLPALPKFPAANLQAELMILREANTRSMEMSSHGDPGLRSRYPYPWSGWDPGRVTAAQG